MQQHISPKFVYLLMIFQSLPSILFVSADPSEPGMILVVRFWVFLIGFFGPRRIRILQVSGRKDKGRSVNYDEFRRMRRNFSFLPIPRVLGINEYFPDTPIRGFGRYKRR